MISSKGTCLLTNASIDTNDELYVYIIEKKDKKGNDLELFTSPMHFYSPISFSIKAKYCEYSYLKSVENGEFHLNYLKTNKDFMNYKKLEDLLIDIYTGSNGLTKYKLVFMLKDVLLNTIAHYEIHNNESLNKNFEKDLYNVSIEQRSNQLFVDRVMSDDLYSQEMILSIKNTINEKTFETYKDFIYELNVINALLYFLRKIWFPTIGLDNPNDNVDLQLQIMNELKILKKK